MLDAHSMNAAQGLRGMFVEAIVSVGSMLLMGSYSGGGNGNCNFAGLESSASIDVAETKAKRIFRSSRKGEGKSIQCVEGEEGRQKNEGIVVVRDYVLKFDGTSYQVPRSLRALLD
ncbi:MAG: hypothetical protein WDN30_03240 [Pararobbsia sp.]